MSVTMRFSRAVLVVAVLALISAPGIRAQADSSEPGGAITPDTADGLGNAESGGGGFNLFPFYMHEVDPSDQSESLHVAGLYHRTRKADGSESTLFLPFYYSLHSEDPPDDRFYLFPLYYERTSPEESFRYLIPFWLERQTDEGRLTTRHVLFPLVRYSEDRRSEDRPVERFRAGIPYVLEAWESRSTPNTMDQRALTLFNWNEESQGGVSVYSRTSIRENEVAKHSGHLFPFIWYADEPDRGHTWLLPFYGHTWSGPERDYYVLPILSRFGFGEGESVRLDLLFPLFHYARDEESFSLASYPLFEYSREPGRGHLSVLFWLYRDYFRVSQAGNEHSRLVLFPLGYFHSTPTGEEGTEWLFPYLNTYDRESRLRLVLPLHIKHESRAAGEVTSYVTVTLPTYASWGAPDDYFSMGIPLWWASREGKRGWEMLLPFYYHFYDSSTSDVHVPPLFSYQSYPDQFLLSLLGPLYVYRRFYDLNREPSGSAHHFLWPLTALDERADGYHYRLLPFFWVTERGDSSDLLLTPFYYQQYGRDGSFFYVFPFYARSRYRNEQTDYYAAGTYFRSETRAQDGSLSRSGDGFLWGLAAFEEDHVSGARHQRILPLGYWHTATEEEHTTLSAPFYYSHRNIEEDKVHSLDLVLGTLYYSSVVEARMPGEQRAELAGDVVGSGHEISREQGILWPLSRWYSNEQGEKGRWVLPFYFDSSAEGTDIFAVFPMYYSQTDQASRRLNYWRYFFLYNEEEWATGSRTTVGQVLFDRRYDSQDDSRRFRVFYPLFEFATSNSGSSFMVTPLFTGRREQKGGTRSDNYTFFPFFWKGSEERLAPSGDWVSQASHFFLFPFYGSEGRPTRRDTYVLYPLFHLQQSVESVNVQLWPFFFYRKNPALEAVMLWPLHASETGGAAGDLWVTRYLFLSKLISKENGFSYRLDPFLFRVHSAPDNAGIGALFELWAYDRTASRTSFRLLPFAFGHSDDESSSTAVLPLFYNEDFGTERIEGFDFWRIFFLASALAGGDGERRFSVLTKLFEYSHNPQRPAYHEVRVLHRLFLDASTETTSRLELHPFFQYSRDEAADESEFSLLYFLYRQRTVRGQTTRSIFGLIPF